MQIIKYNSTGVWYPSLVNKSTSSRHFVLFTFPSCPYLVTAEAWKRVTVVQSFETGKPLWRQDLFLLRINHNSNSKYRQTDTDGRLQTVNSLQPNAEFLNLKWQIWTSKAGKFSSTRFHLLTWSRRCSRMSPQAMVLQLKPCQRNCWAFLRGGSSFNGLSLPTNFLECSASPLGLGFFFAAQDLKPARGVAAAVQDRATRQRQTCKPRQRVVLADAV